MAGKNTLLIFVFVGLGVGALIALLAARRAKSPVGKPCSVYGAAARFGYSERAEAPVDEIEPMCFEHLMAKLESDYEAFQGRAVVIEPAAGPPCYVFQPGEEWRTAFKDTKIADDVSALIAEMKNACHECGQQAKYVWVGSKGMTEGNFGQVLERGLCTTLLPQNPTPVSLCARCCVRRIANALESKRLSYLEVCGPKGGSDGFVVPMGY